MSPQDSTSPGIYNEKPRSDVYTVLLAISLTAIVIAILLLVVELSRYGGQTSPRGAGPAPAGATQLAATSGPRLTLLRAA